MVNPPLASLVVQTFFEGHPSFREPGPRRRDRQSQTHSALDNLLWSNWPRHAPGLQKRTPPTTTPTPTPTSTPTGGSIATFDGDFILCVQAGATLDFRAQDGSATSGHFTTTAYITAGNCSGPVNVTGTLTSAQGPFKISVPAITSPSTNTAVIVAQAIGATNATVTTAVESGVLKIIITPNSYPSTVTLSGTLTVTFP